MKPDDFERELQRRPLRRIPPDWKAVTLPPAKGVPWWNRIAEYIWPSRAAWGALAAVWVFTAVLRMATVEQTSPTSRVLQTDYAQLRLVMEQKRELEAVDLEGAEPSPDSSVTKPRSHARRKSTVA